MKAAASTDVRRGTEAQDYRASLARAARRADAGEDPGLCGVCATEADVDAPAHDPGCRLKPAAEEPPAEAAGKSTGFQWEKGRDGKRRSVKERDASGELTSGEMQRRHDVFLDAQPMTTSCAVAGCGWSFAGTAEQARDAARAHRETEHPAPARRRTARRGLDA